MNQKRLTRGRGISAFILAAFLLFTSVACSSGMMTGSNSSRDPGVVPDQGNSGGFDSDTGGKPAEGGGSTDDGIDLARKIITTTSIRMESPDVTQAVNDLAAYARELGGYIQSEYQRESAGSYYGELVVRIPADSVDEFVLRTDDFGEIKENKVSINDVTADYTDTASRLKNAQVQETRLLAMFEEANTIDELLYIQTELDRLQERIELYEGQIRLWDNLIDMATISLDIYEEAALIEAGSSVPRYIPANTVWERFTNGVQSSWVNFVNGTSRFVIWLGQSFIQLLFIILLAVIVVLIIRRQRRRRPVKFSPINQQPTRAYVSREDTNLPSQKQTEHMQAPHEPNNDQGPKES